jgi:hypothetical protein
MKKAFKELNIKTLSFERWRRKSGKARHADKWNNPFTIRAATPRPGQTITQVKDLVIQDTNGFELDFGSDIVAVEQIKVGDKATVSPDGLPAEGNFIFYDGRILEFKGGVLQKITPPTPITEQ